MATFILDARKNPYYTISFFNIEIAIAIAISSIIIFLYNKGFFGLIGFNSSIAIISNKYQKQGYAYRIYNKFLASLSKFAIPQDISTIPEKEQLHKFTISQDISDCQNLRYLAISQGV